MNCRASEGVASETELNQLRDLLGSSPSVAQTLQTTATTSPIRASSDSMLPQYPYLSFS
jgi:hypothetical protein